MNWKITDFNVVRRLGVGSCSTVAHCVLKESGVEYAIKIIDKSLLKRNSLMEYIIRERNILDNLNDKGVAKLKFTFQDPCHLCEFYNWIRIIFTALRQCQPKMQLGIVQ